MKFFFITPTQKIEVDPMAYVSDKVQCDIPQTEINITVNIKDLRTDKDEEVTRPMLSEYFETV